jgi:hypothetical protein
MVVGNVVGMVVGRSVGVCVGMVVGGNVGITVGLWVGACQVMKRQYDRGMSAWTMHVDCLTFLRSGANDSKQVEQEPCKPVILDLLWSRNTPMLSRLACHQKSRDISA